METLIQKAPYIAALVAIVYIFVRAWKDHEKRQEREQVRREQFDLARMTELERIGKACHSHTKELNDRACRAIDNASRIIENNTKIIGAIEQRLNGGGR